jgi:hypothetical protein
MAPSIRRNRSTTGRHEPGPLLSGAATNPRYEPDGDALGPTDGTADSDGDVADGPADPLAGADSLAAADALGATDALGDSDAVGLGLAVGTAVGRGVGRGVSRPLPPKRTA